MATVIVTIVAYSAAINHERADLWASSIPGLVTHVRGKALSDCPAQTRGLLRGFESIIAAHLFLVRVRLAKTETKALSRRRDILPSSNHYDWQDGLRNA
jgi:hypothetical protein